MRVSSVDDVQNPKPAPDVFLHAAKHLGVEPKAIIVLGDTMNDALAAKAAGMGFMGVVATSHNPGQMARDMRAAGAINIIHDYRYFFR